MKAIPIKMSVLQLKIFIDNQITILKEKTKSSDYSNACYHINRGELAAYIDILQLISLYNENFCKKISEVSNLKLGKKKHNYDSKIYKNTVKEPTVNERIEECKRLGMNDISVSMYPTYSSVNCIRE